MECVDTLVFVQQVINHLLYIEKPISRGQIARLDRLSTEAKIKWAKNMMKRHGFTFEDVQTQIRERNAKRRKETIKDIEQDQKQIRSIAHDIREGILQGDFFGKSLWLTYKRHGYEAAQEHYEWLREEKGPAATIHAITDLDERWAEFKKWYNEHTACRNR